MRWRPSLIFLVLNLGMATLAGETSYTEVERAYLRALYHVQKPILEKHLVRLKSLRTKAQAQGLDALTKEIREEISKLEAQIKREATALKEFENVPPITTTPAS